MKPAKSKKRRVISLIIGSSFLMFIGFCFGVLSILYPEYSDPNANAIAMAKNGIEHPYPLVKSSTTSLGDKDPTLESYLKDLKATYVNNLDVSFVDSYSKGTGLGQYNQGYDGDLMSDGTTLNRKRPSINVLSGRSLDDTKRTLAHEYMHHIWYTQFDKSEQIILSSKLITAYSGDAQMQNAMQNYIVNNSLEPTEILSSYCTDSSDSYLTPDILTTCNKYINRSALVMLR